MKLKLVVAGAAIGCALGSACLALPSGVANAAPPCECRHRGQCGPGASRRTLRRSATRRPPQRGHGGAAYRVISVGPAVQVVRHRATSADLGGPGGPPSGTSEGRAVPTSAGPTTTISAWTGQPRLAATVEPRRQRLARSIPRRPVGWRPAAVGLGCTTTARRGTGHCRTRGDRRPHRSTTGASRSNRYGIRVTTNGASSSSGSGFRSRSDLRRDGRP